MKTILGIRVRGHLKTKKQIRVIIQLKPKNGGTSHQCRVTHSMSTIHHIDENPNNNQKNLYVKITNFVMSNFNNIGILFGFIIIALLIVYYGETSISNEKQIILLINGTNGTYDQLDTIISNTEQLHPSQDTICQMLDDELCEIWQYNRDNASVGTDEAYNQNYYWHN